MIDYGELNKVVNEIIFGGTYAAAPVYLSLEDDERDGLASCLGVPPDKLDVYVGTVVAATLDFGVANIYRMHQLQLRKWQRQNMDTAPPFSALLLTLTLAAERMRNDGAYSATNYYQRLFEVLGTRTNHQKQRIRFAGKYTRQFWHALNLWLTEFDYAFGKPTAKQVNSWAYVSYALSQSLVRQADRVKFHNLFAQFGLSPNDKLSESEIMLYLHEWMAGSGPSRWLKRLWESPDIRERIASAALDELEHWDGRSADAEFGVTNYRRLSWLAILRRFPRPSVQLHLVAGASDDEPGVTLQLAAGATELAREALASAERVRLESMSGTNLRTLAPEDRIKLGALLLTSIELEAEEEGDLYRHDSRPLVPLIKDESGPYYREVTRVSSYTKHLVLCHTNWAGRIKDYLEESAQPGFTEMKGGNSNGIPSGWTLFLDVELHATPTTEVSDNLQCLVPISSGATVAMSDGLKLAENIWHASAPPQVVVFDGSGFVDTSLQTESIGAKSTIISSTTARTYDPNFIGTSNHVLDGMNLKIVGTRDGKQVVQRSMAFRSARTPRRRAGLEANYAYPLNSAYGGFWGFSAKPLEELEPRRPCVRGMLVTGELEDLETGYDVTGSGSMPIWVETQEQHHGFNMASVTGDEATCILRGYHYFICEPYLGPGQGEVSRTMQCRDCHIFQIAAQSKRLRRKRGGHRSIARKHASNLRIVRKSEAVVSPDSVYDAVCYLGSGTWASLVPVLSVLVAEPWEVTIVRDELVDLGLIDLVLDYNFGQPRYWSCSPPTLVLTQAGTAFLAGFRNAQLIRDLKERLDRIAGPHRVIRQEFAPLAHLWNVKNLGVDAVRHQCKEIRGPLERPIAVVKSPGVQVANQMPSIDEMRKHMNPIQVEEGDDIERFDPKSCKWEQAELRSVGAYRALFRGRRYFYRAADGSALEAGPELVKILAARDEGVRLHAYNEAEDSFECVIGCKPPGLFRRALVSASGVQCSTSGHRHVYRQVPKALAALVLHKLYST